MGRAGQEGPEHLSRARRAAAAMAKPPICPMALSFTLITRVKRFAFMHSPRPTAERLPVYRCETFTTSLSRLLRMQDEGAIFSFRHSARYSSRPVCLLLFLCRNMRSSSQSSDDSKNPSGSSSSSSSELLLLSRLVRTAMAGACVPGVRKWSLLHGVAFEGAGREGARGA